MLFRATVGWHSDATHRNKKKTNINSQLVIVQYTKRHLKSSTGRFSLPNNAGRGFQNSKKIYHRQVSEQKVTNESLNLSNSKKCTSNTLEYIVNGLEQTINYTEILLRLRWKYILIFDVVNNTRLKAFCLLFKIKIPKNAENISSGN